VRVSFPLRDSAIRAILVETIKGDTMREVNATDLKNQFGEFLDLARAEPVGIRKSGKLTAVMVSAEEYEHLQRLDDAYWIARAEAAEARGQWVGPDEALQHLASRLKQPD
jgi:antitoxin Phd